MKKTIITLLAILVCSIMPMQAYEYFTIYFSDGTKSNAFYATDVDSICYSKIGLDSIEYADWQVQEIYTCDSIYRYSLAQIDSLSFKDVDIDVVAEDIDRANSVIVPLYMQCESIAELSQHLSTIVDIEGVEDAWTDNQTLFVKIRDYGTITFLYPPTPSSDDENFISLESRKMITRSDVVATNHTPIEVHNACVYYQPENNEEYFFKAPKKYSHIISDNFNTMEISCQHITNAGPDFFVKDIFDYDLIFLITHGFYEKETNIHWLVTSNEVYKCSEFSQDFYHTKEICEDLKDNLVYSPEKLSYTWLWEVRGGIDYAVFYTCVSDKLIASSRNSFKNSETVLFNTACESLKQNNNLANVFLNKGAICYLGYDDSNSVGHFGGYSFYQAMLNGTCIEQAYNRIPDSFKEEYYVDVDEEIEYRPKLHMITKNDDDLKKCIVHTETLPVNNLSSDNNNPIRVTGRIKMLNNNYFTQCFTYGFQISTNPDMSQAVDSTAVGIYDSSTLYMNWADTIDVRTLQPNTTYYYRAYMNDGASNCYGEVKSFTTENIEAYAVLNDGTLTFYYDGKMNERIGSVIKNISFFYKKWVYFESWYDDVYIVDFDPSFYYYTPLTTSHWFYAFHNLTEIRNIKWLNTSKTTDMFEMFAECKSLKSLDLRSFDTSNVIRMQDMFAGCSSLTDLDISSFDTRKVTTMGGMFFGCSSLTSIDVSSLNTANVTDLGHMFYNCSSIEILDLSHFITKDTNIVEMFTNCSSLTTIYAGNWSYLGSDFMFRGCNNLVGGRGTKVGVNNYIDENGVQHSYTCSESGGAAHIDGGKDWPGLFTAK